MKEKENKDVIDMDVFRKAGRKGGLIVAKRYDKAWHIKIGKLGALKRWGEKGNAAETPLEVDQNSVKK